MGNKSVEFLQHQNLFAEDDCNPNRVIFAFNNELFAFSL